MGRIYLLAQLVQVKNFPKLKKPDPLTPRPDPFSFKALPLNEAMAKKSGGKLDFIYLIRTQ